MTTPPAITLHPAVPADATAIAALLQSAGLPNDGIEPHLAHFLVARAGGEIVGTIGAEVCGPDALLRSLAVSRAMRGAGLGRRLVTALEQAAVRWNVKRWWLLTTTAQAFFAADGFAIAERTTAPAAIRQTGQFCGGICRSAACMSRVLRTGP